MLFRAGRAGSPACRAERSGGGALPSAALRQCDKLKLYFGNSKIEVEINMAEEKKERYVFKSYRLEDFDEKGYSYAVKDSIVELDKFGKIKFVSRVRKGGKHNTLEIYLTSLENDVLYDFAEFDCFPNDFNVKEFSFVDLNRDNLKDLIIILSCNEDDTINNVRVYFQNKKGGFDINEDLYDKLNNEENVNDNILNIEKYIKNNFILGEKKDIIN